MLYAPLADNGALLTLCHPPAVCAWTVTERPAGDGNTVPLNLPIGSVGGIVVKLAHVSARPKMLCSWLPVTVLVPRVPTTCACTIRGETPWRVTAIPTR